MASSGTPSVAGDSHEGVRGKKNEDSWAYFAIDSVQGADPPVNQTLILIVADGVTGQVGGEQASQIAVGAIQKHLNRPSSQPLRTRLEDALALANQEILTKAEENPDWGRMSTTVVLAALQGDRLSVAHVGDSRAYLVRDGTAYLLTLDHTWVQEAIDGDRLSQVEAKIHPNRHTILHYLGINGRVESDLRILIPGQQGERTSEPIILLPGDGLLLCSDGLSDKVKAQEIAQIVTDNYRRPKAAVQHLIGQALQRQEADNITALLATLPTHKSGIFGLGQYWAANRVLVTALVVLIVVAFAFVVREFGSGTPSTGGAAAQEDSVNRQEGTPSTQPIAGETDPSFIGAAPSITATLVATGNGIAVLPTSTRAPTPSATITPTETAAPRSQPSNTPIPSTSAASESATTSTNIRVELVSPPDGFNVLDPVTFRWRPNPSMPSLPAGFCYEVLLRRKGSASEPSFGIGGATTATQVMDNLRSNPLVSPNTDYEWAVWLTQCPPNYQALQVISEVYVLKSPPLPRPSGSSRPVKP